MRLRFISVIVLSMALLLGIFDGTARAQECGDCGIGGGTLDGLYLNDGSYYVPTNGSVASVAAELANSTGPNCQSGACTTGLETHGPINPNAASFDGMTLPGATSESIGPSAQTLSDSSTTPTAQPLAKTYHKDGSVTGAGVDAGYALDASLAATPASGSASAKLDSSAQLVLSAHVFGIGSNNLAAVKVTSRSDQYSTVNSKASILIVGQQVWSEDLTSYHLNSGKFLDEIIAQTSSPFIEYLYGYAVYIIPEAHVHAGYTLTGSLNVAGPQITFTPEADLTEDIFEIAIDTYTGLVVPYILQESVTLAKVTTPLALTIVASDCSNLKFSFDGHVTANSGAGKLTVSILIGGLFYTYITHPVTLLRWAGLTFNSDPVHIAGTQPFNFICTTDFQNAINPPPPPPPPPPPGCKRLCNPSD